MTNDEKLEKARKEFHAWFPEFDGKVMFAGQRYGKTESGMKRAYEEFQERGDR